MKIGTSRGGHPYAALLLAVLVVGLLITAGLLGTSVVRAQGDEKQRKAALQSARQTAINLSSLDYKQVQPSIDRVMSGLTGEAKNSWAGQAQTLTQTLTKAQSVSSAQQIRAAIVSMDGDSAEIIVAVTALTTTPKVPQGAARDFRYAMSLTRTDGHWLVSDLGMTP